MSPRLQRCSKGRSGNASAKEETTNAVPPLKGERTLKWVGRTSFLHLGYVKRYLLHCLILFYVPERCYNCKISASFFQSYFPSNKRPFLDCHISHQKWNNNSNFNLQNWRQNQMFTFFCIKHMKKLYNFSDMVLQEIIQIIL